MDEELRQKLKETVGEAITNFFYNKEVRVTHVLDRIFPAERRIRSLIGGLETSIGTTIWEPIARLLAEHNGFSQVEDKLLMPSPFPPPLYETLNECRSLRENRASQLHMEECVRRLKEKAASIDRGSLTYVNTKVAPVYEQFISKYPDTKRLSRARLSSVEAIVHPLGLHYRAAQLRELAKAVLKAHGGKMPADRDSLLSLPGVGDYTASALLCFAYGHQVPIIDTNVVRLYTRYFGLKHRLPSSSPNSDIKDIARRALPKGKARDYNYAVLDFAAAVCKHYSPACSSCPLRAGCKHWSNGQAKA